MSYGAIHFWRVKADRLEEHAAVMDAILRAERERCPEVLLNLTFGPSESGDFAEVQLYPDRAACEGFGSRVQREAGELQRLWERHGTLVEPEGSRPYYFQANAHLSESFLRGNAQVGGIEARGSRLAGKVALVTGATRGNGFGIARALAARGADVALNDLPEMIAETNRSAERLRAEYDRLCVVLAGDVTDEAADQAMVRRGVEELSGLDILVNHAGIFAFKRTAAFTAAG